MLSFLERCASVFWDVIRRIVGLIVPFLSSSRDFSGIGRGLRRLLAFLVLAGILIGLTWVNWHYKLRSLLPDAPTVFGVSLGDYWLPILALLLYLLIWLGWWLWKLLGLEEEASRFPDIDQAWEQAIAALNEAGIDVREPPLYLVLGRPAGSEVSFFNGVQLQLKVVHVPNRPDAPLYVYANRDGIYVTCAGASLLGRQADILAGAGDGVPESGFGAGEGGTAMDPTKTIGPNERLQDVQAVLRRAREQGRGPNQLTPQEEQEIRLLVAQDEVAYVQQKAKPRPQLLRHTEEVKQLTARLQHLCRLIVRDRQPFCPVNGVLLLLPIAATDTKEDADQTGALSQHDLATVRRTLQVHCPLFTMVCDLETIPGFCEFIDRFPVDQRQRRVGQRFPLLPDLNEDEAVTDWVDRSVQWICQSLFPTWVYKLFRVETAGREEFSPVVRGNIRLYQLMSQISERQKRLSHVLTRGLTTESQPWLFGGCYLAGTGTDATREQAFTAGVFRRLIENQNYVSWTVEAEQEEAKYARLVYALQIGIAAGILLLLGMLYYAFTHLK
jgi:hypothetical protein